METQATPRIHLPTNGDTIWDSENQAMTTDGIKTIQQCHTT